jgi:hypothetical protein
MGAVKPGPDRRAEGQEGGDIGFEALPLSVRGVPDQTRAPRIDPDVADLPEPRSNSDPAKSLRTVIQPFT